MELHVVGGLGLKTQALKQTNPTNCGIQTSPTSNHIWLLLVNAAAAAGNVVLLWNAAGAGNDVLL